MISDEKIIPYKNLTKIRDNANKNNKTIVFTSGCYDIVHLGHIIHFNYCKSKGDILVVSLGNDKTLRALKGPSRPINSEILRARLLASIIYIDYVVLSKEYGIMDHNEIVMLLKPDKYIVPSTDKYLKEKKTLVMSVGGEMVTCKRLPPGNIKGGISSTSIAAKLSSE